MEYFIGMEICCKLALFCNVDVGFVIEVIDVESIYDVFLLMLCEKFDIVVIICLCLKDWQELQFNVWKNFLGKFKNFIYVINIGLVGKYNELQDVYKFIYEFFVYVGVVNECKVKVYFIYFEQLEGMFEEVVEWLWDFDGVLVVFGFGECGIEGKINVIKYVWEQQVLFFGICLGMQCVVVEFVCNVMQLEGVFFIEVDFGMFYFVIDLMFDQKKIIKKGGIMCLGVYFCEICCWSKVSVVYGSLKVSECYCYCYEFNN